MLHKTSLSVLLSLDIKNASALHAVNHSAILIVFESYGLLTSILFVECTSIGNLFRETAIVLFIFSSIFSNSSLLLMCTFCKQETISGMILN